MIPSITVKTFEQWLEELAPPDLAASWDNIGLQVGDRKSKVNKVLVGLNPSLAVLNEAVSNRCNLIITHHPLIFNPLKKIDVDDSPGCVIRLAIRNDISILAAHTNLDAADGGVNDTLAGLLEVANVKKLSETGITLDDDVLGAIVRVGEFEQAMEIKEVVTLLKEKLLVENVTVVTGTGTRIIKKVLLCGGSGGSAIKVALQLACDALISGDIKYHDAMYAYEKGITVFDVGHFASEFVIVDRLARFFELKLQECKSDIEVLQARSETDPFVVM